MSIRTSRWPAGTPCWADVVTPDPAASRAFYSAVLGWTYQDSGPEYGGYTIAETPGAPGAAVAGLSPMSDGVTPPCWTLYLAADDADQTAAAISENGGTILYPPMDVGPMGRMLIAADPTGAAFGVWQAGTRIGSELVNQPGGLTWEDLRSPDPAAAQAFYTTIFGFSTAEIEMAGPDYRTFAHPEKPDVPLGGMGPMMGADGAGAHWLIYFGVADAEAAVSVATANGGQVVAPAFASPYGTMAGLADPAGAVFWVVETTDDDPAGRAG